MPLFDQQFPLTHRRLGSPATHPGTALPYRTSFVRLAIGHPPPESVLVVKQDEAAFCVAPAKNNVVEMVRVVISLADPSIKRDTARGIARQRLLRPGAQWRPGLFSARPTADQGR